MDCLGRNVCPGLVDTEVSCYRVHAVTRWLRLEGPYTTRATYSRLPRAVSRWLLDISKDGVLEIFPKCCAAWAPQGPSGSNQRPTLWVQTKA